MLPASAISSMAPELPSTLEWVNSPPLALKDLRGRVVLLDFWTYCCINCLHVLPDLAYLEKKYGEKLVIIGIHSPKFPNEKVARHVLQAVQRYHIQHPVANDPALITWQHYGIHAWPSLVLIAPDGHIMATFSGEGHRAQLDTLIAETLEKFQNNLTISSPISLSLLENPANTLLRFPGKIIASREKIYIADTGHDRILEASHNGEILRAFGNSAVFNAPQGLALWQQHLLLIADTGNHALKQINLWTGEIMPLATPVLNSPWDVTLSADGHTLWIAMAGSHQIWQYDFLSREIGPLAGSGHEALWDGFAAHAAFAQPSGITADSSSQHLYIADAESSSVRVIYLPEAGESAPTVTTLIGTGLFDWGDEDGTGRLSKLQHPLGISYDRDRHGLWLADSYNHKIRFIDLHHQEVTTLALQHSLAEPGGVYYHDNILWIADTNHHRIVRYDIKTREEAVLFAHWD